MDLRVHRLGQKRPAADVLGPGSLCWSTVHQFTSPGAAGVKAVAGSDQALYAAGRSSVGRWLATGRSEPFLPDDTISAGIHAITLAGGSLFCCSSDGNTTRFHATEGWKQGCFSAHIGEVVCIANWVDSRTGTEYIMTGGVDFQVKTWTAQGQLMAASGHHHGRVNCLHVVQPATVAGQPAGSAAHITCAKLPSEPGESGQSSSLQRITHDPGTGSARATATTPRQLSRVSNGSRSGPVSRRQSMRQGTQLGAGAQLPLGRPGPVLLSGSVDGAVFVWQDRSGSGLISEAEGVLLKHPVQKGVTSLLGVGSSIWAGCDDGKVIIWNSAPGSDHGYALGRDVVPHTGQVSCLVLLGNYVLSGSADRTICCLDGSTGSTLYRIPDQGGYIKALVPFGWTLWAFTSKGINVLSCEAAWLAAKERGGTALSELESKAAEAKRLKALAEECDAENERLVAESGRLQEKLDSLEELHKAALAEQMAKHEAALGEQKGERDLAASKVQQMLAELRAEHDKRLAAQQADHEHILAKRQLEHQEELSSLHCKLADLEAARQASVEEDKLHWEGLLAAQQGKQQERLTALEGRLAVQEAQHAEQLAALQADLEAQQARHAAQLAEQQAMHDMQLREAQKQAQESITTSQQEHSAEAQRLRQQLAAMRARESQLVQQCEKEMEEHEVALQHLQELLDQEKSLAQQRHAEQSALEASWQEEKVELQGQLKNSQAQVSQLAERVQQLQREADSRAAEEHVAMSQAAAGKEQAAEAAAALQQQIGQLVQHLEADKQRQNQLENNLQASQKDVNAWEEEAKQAQQEASDLRRQVAALVKEMQEAQLALEQAAVRTSMPEQVAQPAAGQKPEGGPNNVNQEALCHSVMLGEPSQQAQHTQQPAQQDSEQQERALRAALVAAQAREDALQADLSRLQIESSSSQQAVAADLQAMREQHTKDAALLASHAAMKEQLSAAMAELEQLHSQTGRQGVVQQQEGNGSAALQAALLKQQQDSAVILASKEAEIAELLQQLDQLQAQSQQAAEQGQLVQQAVQQTEQAQQQAAKEAAALQHRLRKQRDAARQECERCRKGLEALQHQHSTATATQHKAAIRLQEQLQNARQECLQLHAAHALKQKGQASSQTDMTGGGDAASGSLAATRARMLTAEQAQQIHALVKSLKAKVTKERTAHASTKGRIADLEASLEEALRSYSTLAEQLKDLRQQQQGQWQVPPHQEQQQEPHRQASQQQLQLQQREPTAEQVRVQQELRSRLCQAEEAIQQRDACLSVLQQANALLFRHAQAVGSDVQGYASELQRATVAVQALKQHSSSLPPPPPPSPLPPVLPALPAAVAIPLLVQPAVALALQQPAIPPASCASSPTVIAPFKTPVAWDIEPGSRREAEQPPPEGQGRVRSERRGRVRFLPPDGSLW